MVKLSTTLLQLSMYTDMLVISCTSFSGCKDIRVNTVVVSLISLELLFLGPQLNNPIYSLRNWYERVGVNPSLELLYLQ